MPITVSAQDYATRWSQGLQGSTTKISQGVDAVSTAPSQRAIAAKTKMLANFQASVNNGKWERNTAKVSLSDWQTAMKTKGIQRIGQGAQAAEGKMAAFAAQLLPYEQSLQNTVRNMPSLTLQNNIDRAVAWINGMAKFQPK